MKEFEKDNWEMKVKHLADAFQPQPDKAAWLNVEAAIADKKRKKFLLILFYVIGFAILIVSGFVFKSYNTVNDYSTSATNVSANVLGIEKNNSEKNSINNISINTPEIVKVADKSNKKNSETNNVVNATSKKSDATSSATKNVVLKSISVTNTPAISQINTIEKQNEFTEKPDELAAHEINVIIPMPPPPLQACSFAFRDEPKRLTDLPIGWLDYVTDKKSIWSVMIGSSTIIQQSKLNNIDTIQSIEKLPTHYFDGSIHLIYQHPKWKSLELNFSAGFYEMTQQYTLEKILPPNSTITGTTLALNSPKSYSQGSEFYRTGFLNFQLAFDMYSSKRFSWNVSMGIQSEYLLNHSADNSTVGLLLFGNQFSNAYAAEDLYPNMNSELNRIYLKAMVSSSLRYSLSDHFALQSGIVTKYAITDRYKKSSTLRQRDFNLGLNAGLIYKF